MGSEGSAAGGGRSDPSEWQRSIKSRESVSPKILSGTATGGIGRHKIPISLYEQRNIRRYGGIGRHKGLKIPRGKTRTGSIPVSGTKNRTPLWVSCFWYQGYRNRTVLNATVRWTVAATSSKTGGYNNFRQRRKCKSIPVSGILISRLPIIADIFPNLIEPFFYQISCANPNNNRLPSSAFFA